MNSNEFLCSSEKDERVEYWLRNVETENEDGGRVSKD